MSKYHSLYHEVNRLQGMYQEKLLTGAHPVLIDSISRNIDYYSFYLSLGFQTKKEVWYAKDWEARIDERIEKQRRMRLMPPGTQLSLLDTLA